MRTVALFKNCRSQAVRIPKEYEFQGISEVTIHREGDSLVLRPVRPTWRSFLDVPRLDDDDFLKERPPVIDEDRFIREFEE